MATSIERRISLPMTTSDIAVKSIKGSGLCGRICPYWRMSAGIISLVASVVAVCCAIIWNTHWLCFPFGLSALVSGYTIYLGYEFHHLQTFEKSNEELQESLHELDNENTRLSGEVSRLSGANEQLQSTASHFERLLEESQQAIVDHEELIRQLREEIGKLEELRDGLVQQASTHVNQLRGLHSSLGGIHRSAEANHQTFGEQLGTFSQHVNELAQQKHAWNSASTEAERAMIKQTEALIEAGQMLMRTFEAIKQWKDDKAVSQRIEQMEGLQRTVEEAQRQLREVTSAFSAAKKEIEGLEEQLRDLKTIKEGFDVSLQSLLEKIERLGVENESLSSVKAEIVQAVQIFKRFDMHEL